MNYLTLVEIADMLADVTDIDEITAGTIDNALLQTIGVYQRKEFEPRTCVGVESSYEIAKIRLLVRWSKNPTTAEAKAAEVADTLSALENMPTKSHIIKFADVIGVRAIGKDEKGVCEYIVDADFTYTL